MTVVTEERKKQINKTPRSRIHLKFDPDESQVIAEPSNMFLLQALLAVVRALGEQRWPRAQQLAPPGLLNIY